MTRVQCENAARNFPGCDFVITLPPERKEARLLQLTDMQVIDAAQRRTPDRLRPDEIAAWDPALFDAQCGDHIRSLVAQTHPDLIFITGDIIYGSFDDAGSTFLWFCRFMDSLGIPWAPVFGNHDNESKKGTAWQCTQFEESEFCLFRRGSVSGNGNYTVGIAAGGRLIRVLHMTDSNGCRGAADEEVLRTAGIFPDQLAQIRTNTEKITAAQGREVPAFMAFHIPVKEFADAELEKGYRTASRELYTIGVDVPAADGDFGCSFEKFHFNPITVENFLPFLHENHIDGVFAGHYHSINTCILWEGVRWVFGLKTGQYDYHIPGQLGGTLIEVRGADFTVRHVPALVPFSPFPGKSSIFRNFFAEE